MVLKELQDHALTNLKIREKFQKTGIATLKFRIPTQSSGARGGIGTELLSVEISLTETGKALRELFAEKTNGEAKRVKILAAGKQLSDDKTLAEQNVTNNAQLIALCVPENGKSDCDIYERVIKIKEDAKKLDKSQYFSLENQDGSKVYLPDNEKKALVMALALYNKGRTALCRQNYTEALVLFLEADEQFSTCQSSLLSSVDNYALLNLDIVWCYLCLKSITQLPDAQRRLLICEDRFRRCYGANFDRVIALKGGDGNEKALIMRLHLLQGILYFHMNRQAEAQGLLALAESELRPLLVDPVSITSLLEMGFSLTEARIGLRAANNNLESAIFEITKRRDQKAAARKKAREEENFLENDLDVNPNALMRLLDMGFDKPLAALALRKTDNTVESAVVMLQEQRDELEKSLSKIDMTQFMQKLTTELERQGIDFTKSVHEIAKDIEEASNNPVDPNQPGPSRLPDKTIKKLRKEAAIAKDTDAAFKRFREDYINDEDEYLDLPLDQEQELIREYKGYLNM